MAKKTTVIEEIEPRVAYFEDVIKDTSKKRRLDSMKDDIIDEESAINYLQTVMKSDSSLSNIEKGLTNDVKDGYRMFLERDFIQELILENKTRIRTAKQNLAVKKSGKNLDKAVARLEKKRKKLEKGLPTRSKQTKRVIINKVMTDRMLKNYGYVKTKDKKGITRYRTTKGRFVSNEKLLELADKVLIVSKTKRLELEKELGKDVFGREKKPD